MALLWDFDIDYRSLPFVTLLLLPRLKSGPFDLLLKVPLKVTWCVTIHGWKTAYKFGEYLLTHAQHSPELYKFRSLFVILKATKTNSVTWTLFRGTAARRRRTTRTARDDADGCNWVLCDVRTRSKKEERETHATARNKTESYLQIEP